MAKKIKLTRPELKRQRDALARFERYLPMLELKQQQLQLTLLAIEQQRRRAAQTVEAAERTFGAYRSVLHDVAGVNVEGLAKPAEVRTSARNIAGVSIPTLDDVLFKEASYSLFATPAWVDRALEDLRTLNRRKAELAVIEEQYELLHRELVRVIQRVNMFEKIKIPEARAAIHRIRIHLGDEMAAAVGWAKLAKAKVEKLQATGARESSAATPHSQELVAP